MANEPNTKDDFQPILSDEERAALEGDDDVVEDEEGSDEGGVEAVDTGVVEGGQDGKPAAASSENADGESVGGDSDGVGDDAGADAGDADGPTVVTAPLRAAPVDKAKEALTALDEKESELQTKFDEGDITSGELAIGLKAIAKNRGDIEWALRKNELADEMATQARDNAWYAEVNRFMNGPGKTINASEGLKVAFDSYVRRVTADEANQNLSDRQMLDKAHKLFMADVSGIGGKPQEQKPQPSVVSKPSRRVEAPPTLANIPASEIESADGGRFAALDRLADTDPVKFEKAFAKLPPAEQQAYLEAN